jgi:hypothetical protein
LFPRRRSERRDARRLPSNETANLSGIAGGESFVSLFEGAHGDHFFQ